MCEVGKRLVKVRLDSEWQWRLWEEAGWSVPMRGDIASGRRYPNRFAGSSQHVQRVEREASTVPSRGLQEWRVHRGHALAAILTMMALWGAGH